MSSILIVGTGCIGSAYACVLGAAQGSRVTCISRSNYDTIKRDGLNLLSPILGDREFKPEVFQSVGEAASNSHEPFDFVVVCTKATDVATATVIEQIGPALTHQRTSLVLIQNGLGIEKPFYEAFPETPIISAVVYLPTSQVSPAVFKHSEVEVLHLGLYPSAPVSEHVESFASIVRKGGATAVVHDDIQAERWVKIVANGTVNPICALSRCGDRELVELSKLSAELFKGVMQELASVASSAGYGHIVTPEVVETQLSRCLSRPMPGVQPSMLQDVRAGRPMEVEAILGGIIGIAEEHGVQIPRLSTLYVRLKGLDKAIQGQEQRH